jgi:signal transduction histidine kinase
LTGELEGHWDPRRIEQVLSNLVGNALEHSDEEVTVGIAGQPKTATLTVHNMGPPIPSGDRDRLFEPFRKRESEQAGLGLGLYIVKLIVEAHGGTVDVRSTLETGTRFTCVLPKRRA